MFSVFHMLYKKTPSLLAQIVPWNIGRKYVKANCSLIGKVIFMLEKYFFKESLVYAQF